MTDTFRNPTPSRSRLPFWLATLLVCAVFPLIWVGGLVTSTEAGMAVPDWPGTFGYNLFLYPWTTWYFGAQDIFVEHGHRLLAASSGFIALALVWSLWKAGAPRRLQVFGWLAGFGILSQGVIGGLRVNLNERLLAMLHACTAPIAFALCVTAWFYIKVDAASCRASGVSLTRQDAASTKAFRLALLTTCFAYLQLVLGAVVRHMPVYAPPRTFHVAVMFHLLMAAVLTTHVFLAARAAWKSPSLRVTATGLMVMIVAQLSLGAGTWVVNFGIPQWVQAVATTPDFVVRAQSMPQVMITTAHVAIGSLIVVTSLVLTLKVRQLSAPVVAASLPLGFVLREALR